MRCRSAASGSRADGPHCLVQSKMPYNLSEKSDNRSGIMAGHFKPVRRVRKFRAPVSSRGHKLIRKRSAKEAGIKDVELLLTSKKDLESLRSLEGLVVVDRITELFGMPKAKVAEMVGVRPDTLQRPARASSPKTQTRLKEMVEILRRVADWAGGVPQALAWYRAEPLPEFGGRTAESLVKDGKATAVRDYLDHVALGGFA